MAIALRHSRLIPSAMSFVAYLAAVVEGALALLDGETEGFSIDATSYDSITAASYIGGPVGGTVAVIDTGTPANDLSNVALDSSNLTQSGTSPKMVHFPTSPYARWTPHNIHPSSGQVVDNDHWDNFSASSTANDDTAPDGTATAAKLTPTAELNIHLIGSTNTHSNAAGAVYTASAYVKADGYNFIGIQMGDSSAVTQVCAIYDLSDGSFEGYRTDSATSQGTTVANAGNGWWRISAAHIIANANAMRMHLLVGSTAAEIINVSNWTADGTSGVLLWGAQINRGPIPTPYLATTTTARIGIPLGYDNAASQYGILVEPAATNLLINSASLDGTNPPWAAENATVTANNVTAPDGSTTGATLTSTGGDTHHQTLQTNTPAFTDQTYTGSIYMKAGTHSFASLGFASSGTEWAVVTVNLSTGAVSQSADNGAFTVISTAIEAVGDGWHRVRLTFDPNAAATFFVIISSNSTGTPTYDGDYGREAWDPAGTETFHFWGPQLETGVATSYIPTVGATATRAQDDVIAQASTFPWSATVGAAYADCVAFRTPVDEAVWSFDDDTLNERNNFFRGSGGQRAFVIIDGGALQLDHTTTNTGWTANLRMQGTMGWEANDAGSSSNNSSVEVDDGSVTLPTITQLVLGNVANIIPFNGFIYRFVYVPRHVSDGDVPTWRYNF